MKLLLHIYPLTGILLVWYAPLGVHSAKRRHQLIILL